MDVEKFIKDSIEKIKYQVGDERVVGSCSGGVDSTITAILVYKAVGEQLSCYFIDSGLMRNHDYDDAKKNLNRFGINLTYADYSSDFLDALRGVVDPEGKRKIFRMLFYYSLNDIARKENAIFLAQGTIRADIDETKKGIKTQHNVLEQIGIDYHLKLIEPLVDLYKDDVREIARYLDLYELAERMPFPGPGLATRIEGEVTKEKVELIRKAHEIVEEEAKRNNINPFQIFPALLESKTTAIVDGKRDFTNMIMIRSVDSENAITASITRIPYDVLENMARRLTNELPIKRVSYDITPKPPGTIEII